MQEVKPHLSFQPQNATAAIDIPLKKQNSSRITRKSVSTEKETVFFPECSLQMENGRDVSTISNEVAVAKVKSSYTFWRESSLDLKSVSEVVQFPLEIQTVTDHSCLTRTGLQVDSIFE